MASVPEFSNGYNVDAPNFNLFPDIMGPETPAMRPLIPRLKRVQEDCRGDEAQHDSPPLGPRKKAKGINNSPIEKTTCGEISENNSKFEWLNPPNIRDASGRRPSDPLYDKRTLYIPPDALRKMSASQKQYWSVKCQYMDVVLFFKVVSLYLDSALCI